MPCLDNVSRGVSAWDRIECDRVTEGIEGRVGSGGVGLFAGGGEQEGGEQENGDKGPFRDQCRRNEIKIRDGEQDSRGS